MKRFFGLFLGLLLLNGCTSDKKTAELAEAMKKLDARVAAIEEIIFGAKEKAQTEAYNVPIDNSPIDGNKDAKIHIVVFSNFQCHYCAKADTALRELLKDNDLKDKINIVFKNFPFPQHVQARPAAKAALAAREQDKFWEMAKEIFAHQKELYDPNFKQEKFAEWAKNIGLNVDAFNKALKDNDKKYDEIINKDMELGEAVKLGGTPWMLINGWRLDSPDPASVKKIIAEKKLQ